MCALRVAEPSLKLHTLVSAASGFHPVEVSPDCMFEGFVPICINGWMLTLCSMFFA
jgi:hypothetical protein